MKHKWTLLWAISLGILSIAITNGPTHALASDTDLVKRAQAYGVSKCYDEGKIASSVTTMNNGSLVNLRSIVSTGVIPIEIPNPNDKPQIYFPYNLISINDYNLSCYHTFFGYRGGGQVYPGIVNVGDTSSLVTSEDIYNVMTSLGYQKQTSEAEDSNCIQLSASIEVVNSRKYGYDTPLQKICLAPASSGFTISSIGEKTVFGDRDLIEFTIDGNDSTLGIMIGFSYETISLSTFSSIESATQGIIEKVGMLAVDAGLSSTEACNKVANTSTGGIINSTCITNIHNDPNNTSSGEVTYTLPSKNTMLTTIFGSSLAHYTYPELYRLYVDFYLRTDYKAEIECTDDDTRLEILRSNIGTGTTNVRQVTLYNNGKMDSSCFARPTTTVSGNMYIAQGASLSEHYLSKKADFDELVAAINALSEQNDGLATALASEGNPGVGENASISFEFKESSDEESQLSSDNKITAACMKDSVADSLSWIVCPTIGGLAEGSDGIYGTLKGMLEVKSNLVSQMSSSGSGESAIYMTWGYFRDFANIIFVGVILVLIFSQVTGVGIDNYGIKKMLPKIIVAALLINLSFVICQLAVDISNIFGDGLSLLLSSIAKTIEDRAGFNGGIKIASGIGAGGIITLAGGTYAAAQIVPVVLGFLTGSAATGWIMLIPVIIGLLAAVIAILLFFVMLSLQKMLVIACVVLSPLAFICYTLPNTQSIFKQWLNLFKAVLLLFPICSLLYGIGTIIQVIIFSASTDGIDGWMAILAFVAPLLPYFLAPTLLKRSMALAGDIGARIQGVGQATQRGLRSGATAFRNTEAYQDAQRSADMAHQQRIVNKMKEKLSSSNLSEGQRRRYSDRMSRASDRVKKYEQERTRADATANRILNPNQTVEELVDAAVTEYVENGSNLEATFYQGMSEYGTTFFGAFAQKMSEVDDIGKKTNPNDRVWKDINGHAHRVDGSAATNANLQGSIQRIRTLLNDNAAMSGVAKNKASDAFNMISSGGRGRPEDHAGNIDRTQAASFQDFSYFARHNEVSTSLTDWSTQSRGALIRGAASGTLTVDMMENLLTSDDPSIQSGIQSEQGKREAMQAAVQFIRSGGKLEDLEDIYDSKNKAKFDAAVAAYKSDHPEPSVQQLITVADPNTGSNIAFSGVLPHTQGYQYSGLNSNGHHSYTVGGTFANKGDSWDAESSTLTIDSGHLSPTQRAALAGVLSGFKYDSQVGNASRYVQTVGGHKYEYIVNRTSGSYTINQDGTPIV